MHEDKRNAAVECLGRRPRVRSSATVTHGRQGHLAGGQGSLPTPLPCSATGLRKCPSGRVRCPLRPVYRGAQIRSLLGSWIACPSWRTPQHRFHHRWHHVYVRRVTPRPSSGNRAPTEFSLAPAVTMRLHALHFAVGGLRAIPIFMRQAFLPSFCTFADSLLCAVQAQIGADRNGERQCTCCCGQHFIVLREKKWCQLFRADMSMALPEQARGLWEDTVLQHSDACLFLPEVVKQW